MDASKPAAIEDIRADAERPTRRRIVRAAGGGLAAVLVTGLLSACGGDNTEDEAEGDE